MARLLTLKQRNPTTHPRSLSLATKAQKPSSLYFAFFNFSIHFFNWRKAALQWRAGFCITTRISHHHIEEPPHLPRSSQSAELGSRGYITASPSYLLHTIVSICQRNFPKNPAVFLSNMHAGLSRRAKTKAFPATQWQSHEWVSNPSHLPPFYSTREHLWQVRF